MTVLVILLNLLGGAFGCLAGAVAMTVFADYSHDGPATDQFVRERKSCRLFGAGYGLLAGLVITQFATDKFGAIGAFWGAVLSGPGAVIFMGAVVLALVGLNCLGQRVGPLVQNWDTQGKAWLAWAVNGSIEKWSAFIDKCASFVLRQLRKLRRDAKK